MGNKLICWKYSLRGIQLLACHHDVMGYLIDTLAIYYLGSSLLFNDKRLSSSSWLASENRRLAAWDLLIFASRFFIASYISEACRPDTWRC